MSQPDQEAADDARAEVLRERLYITFTTFAVLIILDREDHLSPAQAALTLLVAVLGTITAGFLSDVISFNLVRQKPAVDTELRHLLAVAWSGLAVIAVPMVLVLCAHLGWFTLQAALRGSLIVLALSLGWFGVLAFKPMQVPAWRKALGLTALVGGAFCVIGLELVAHGGEH